MIDIENMKILGSNVLIKRTPTSGIKVDLIILPDEVKDKYDSVICEVIKVGPGELFESGYREKMEVKPGNKAISYPAYGNEIGDCYWVVDMTELEGIVEAEMEN